MARNRLQGVGQQQYGEQNTPSATYPPPANGVMAPGRQAQGANPYAQQPIGGNPYAQQNVSTAPAGNYNQYAQQPQGYPQQPPQMYGSQQAYGQQQAYAMGNVGNGTAPAAGGDFWAELNTTNSMLSELQERIQALRQAHQQSLNSTDANASVFADQLNNDARASREAVKNQLKKLFKMTQGDKAMKAQADVTRKRFQSLLSEHQNIEKEFRHKVKDRVERQFKIVKPDATPEEVRQVVESDNTQVFSQALLNSNRYGNARAALREVQERHTEIQKIEKTLTELAQMFNEMALLVEQQDEAIANVEGNASAVNQDVESGKNQIERAVVSARKARRKKWICFWIVVLIIAILALVLGIYFGTKHN